MITYEIAKQSPNFCELADVAIDVAKHLYPEGKLLDSKNGSDFCQIILTDRETLTGFELFAQPVEEDEFERVLRVGAELEAKRKEQVDPSLTEISLCLVAHNFSDAFLERARSGFFHVRLFQWSWLSSHRSEALLLEEVRSTMCDAQADISSWACIDGSKPELSTQELIAMARFGIELRDRRAQLISGSGTCA
ncbi:MAG: hypothetical protein A3G87_03340 [Omnitrophica bacterium RIFCSPLOWO2_12_FULL_50_11]|nr:MAG: hypothetical protein A3G87_03340 [Omnitrophica bacterium RIFCSPLOWO2_12_FULL_50_11]